MIMLSKDWLEWFFQAYANRNLLEYVTACSGFFFPHSIRQSYLRASFAGNSAAIACTPCYQDENGKEMWWACGTIAIAPIACHARSLRISLLNNENLVLSKGLIINYHRQRFGKLTFWAINPSLAALNFSGTSCLPQQVFCRLIRHIRDSMIYAAGECLLSQRQLSKLSRWKFDFYQLLW